MDEVEHRFAEVRHWFFQQLEQPQRRAFLHAWGQIPKDVELTVGMEHQALRSLFDAAMPIARDDGKLREALKPFAEHAAGFAYAFGQGPDLLDAGAEIKVTVGDLKRARDVLASTVEEGGE